MSKSSDERDELLGGIVEALNASISGTMEEIFGEDSSEHPKFALVVESPFKSGGARGRDAVVTTNFNMSDAMQQLKCAGFLGVAFAQIMQGIPAVVIAMAKAAMENDVDLDSIRINGIDLDDGPDKIKEHMRANGIPEEQIDATYEELVRDGNALITVPLNDDETKEDDDAASQQEG